MFILRDVRKSDLKGLMRLAAMLNTMNLPHRREALELLIDHAVRSFSGEIEEPRLRQYLFVAQDLESNKIVGTSMIIAQHGTKESPHLYFEVIEDQRYSSTLDRHFHHKILRLGKNFDGPTEIGGLILDPVYRGSVHRLGKQLSYVRFLFIAMNKKWFRKRLLAELMPPLLPDGKSLLWEHLGRHFTELDYQEADYISRTNKEFITSLFPSGEIYVSLLPEKVQTLIGEVGPATQGVRKMLEDVGFEYSYKIDPFDGGPHFEADVKDIELMKLIKVDIVGEQDETTHQNDIPTHLITTLDINRKEKFFAICCAPQFLTKRKIILPRKVIELLHIKLGQKVVLMPLDAKK